MDQRQGALDSFVAQVRVERGELARDEHPLVDERPGAEAREIHARVGRSGVAHCCVVILGRRVARASRSDLVLDALAHDIDPPVQIDASQIVARDEDLAEAGHGGPRARAQHRRVDRHVAPADHTKALGEHDALHLLGSLLGVVGRRRQEADAGGVPARRRQLVAHHVAQEAVRYLDEDARTVAGEGVGPQRAAMLQVAQGLDPERHNLVRSRAADVAHEADAAGVVLVLRVVQALALCGVGSHAVSSREVGVVVGRVSQAEGVCPNRGMHGGGRDVIGRSPLETDHHNLPEPSLILSSQESRQAKLRQSRSRVEENLRLLGP